MSFVDSIFVEQFFLLFYCRRIFVEFDNKTAKAVFFCRMGGKRIGRGPLRVDLRTGANRVGYLESYTLGLLLRSAR